MNKGLIYDFKIFKKYPLNLNQVTPLILPHPIPIESQKNPKGPSYVFGRHKVSQENLKRVPPDLVVSFDFWNLETTLGL